MNNKLDSKTLLEDNTQLWHYGLQSFKSRDTQLVRLESKLQFRILKLKLDSELIQNWILDYRNLEHQFYCYSAKYESYQMDYFASSA